MNGSLNVINSTIKVIIIFPSDSLINRFSICNQLNTRQSSFSFESTIQSIHNAKDSSNRDCVIFTVLSLLIIILSPSPLLEENLNNLNDRDSLILVRIQIPIEQKRECSGSLMRIGIKLMNLESRMLIYTEILTIPNVISMNGENYK